MLALGNDTGNPKPTAYCYNEGTGLWSSAGTRSISRFIPVSVLLPNGKVLLAGGYVGGCCIGASGTGIARSVHDALAGGGKIDFVYGVDDASGLSLDNRRARAISTMFSSEHSSVIAESTAASSGA